MNIIQIQNTEKVRGIFKEWQETIIWSCLERTMGDVFADASESPESAMAILGDFCFLSGRPNRELAAYKPEQWERSFVIMVPQNEEWGALVTEVYGNRAKKVIRYAIKKENDVWDRDKLKQAVDSLSDGFVMQMIDRRMFEEAGKNVWMEDLVSQYSNFEQYEEMGLGVVVLKDGVPVSGASSYSSYPGGIEIQIDTRMDFRRKGLAYACGAKLILECIRKGWYPSWDAHNMWSVNLAEKLGYHYDRKYTAFEVEW